MPHLASGKLSGDYQGSFSSLLHRNTSMFSRSSVPLKNRSGCFSRPTHRSLNTGLKLIVTTVRNHARRIVCARVTARPWHSQAQGALQQTRSKALQISDSTRHQRCLSKTDPSIDGICIFNLYCQERIYLGCGLISILLLSGHSKVQYHCVDTGSETTANSVWPCCSHTTKPV